MTERPKLRNVEKYQPLYPLNKFPHGFGLKLGREIIYLLASRGTARLEGSDWEEIFARLIGAQWMPSNVGLDDIVYEQIAWGAKTVKSNSPFTTSKLRLISGRNSVAFSYGLDRVKNVDPNEIGKKVLKIYNERVASVRSKYMHLRTVVLIKSNDLLNVSIFEIDTVMFDIDSYFWEWNVRGNLVGFTKDKQHKFTWQPHGSQFTIIEDVPASRLLIKIKAPPQLDKEMLLKSIAYDDSWVEIL